MIKINEIAFVAYPTKNIEKAKEFYGGILGLTQTYTSEKGDWIEYDIGSSTLSVGQMDSWDPTSHGPSAALEVEDFEDAVKFLRDNDVLFSMGPFETPVCHMVIVNDFDGNSLIIHKRK
jgi:catechol 2,3-dioxygenase-like lactoylglutathione lyase family enzyme